MMSALLLALALIGAALPAAAGSSAAGTAGAAFLRLSPGARESAMGGAFGGVAEGALASHYNPAGLAFQELVEAGAGREARFEGLNYDYAAIAAPMLSWVDSPRKANASGVAALSVFSLSASGIERRGLVETDSPNGTFTASDRAYALSYGLILPETKLALGGTVKLVDSQLETKRATALTGDVGLLYRSGAWSAGAGVRNSFGRLRLGASSDPLPADAYIGGGWRPRKGWLIAAQLDQPREDEAALSAGLERRVEVSPGLTAAARLGYRTDRSDLGRMAGASLGFGVAWRAMDADLSWSPGGMLGDVFQYSIRVRF